MAEAKQKYHFTVTSLLKTAGRRRCQQKKFLPQHTDHVVELQLVVAALNRLPNDSYSAGDLGHLIDFFNDDRNLQGLDKGQNETKGKAVSRLIKNSRKLTGEDKRKWIQPIRVRWDDIKDELHGFDEFKRYVDEILDVKFD